ncbi:hypothetical protein OC834_002832 [Tilletia horrida]|nr:hypothetical protein OC834_002832 [Tilletia horrida]
MAPFTARLAHWRTAVTPARLQQRQQQQQQQQQQLQQQQQQQPLSSILIHGPGSVTGGRTSGQHDGNDADDEADDELNTYELASVQEQPGSPDTLTRTLAQVVPPIDPETGDRVLESDRAADDLGLPSLIAPEPTEATARVLEAARATRPGGGRGRPIKGTRAAAARAVAEAAQISYQAAAQSGHLPPATSLSAWQWPLSSSLVLAPFAYPPETPHEEIEMSPRLTTGPTSANINHLDGSLTDTHRTPGLPSVSFQNGAGEVPLTSVLRSPSGPGPRPASNLLHPTFGAATADATGTSAGPARLHFAPEQRRVRRKDLPPAFEVGDTYRGLDAYVLESRERRKAEREGKSKRRSRRRGGAAGSSSRGKGSRSSSLGDGASTASGWSSSSSSSSSNSTDSTSSGEGHGLTIARLRAFFGDASSSSSSSSSSDTDSDTSSTSTDDISGTGSRWTDASSTSSSSSSSSASGRSSRSGFSLSLSRVRSNISNVGGRRRRFSFTSRGPPGATDSASVLSGVGGAGGRSTGAGAGTDPAGRTPRIQPGPDTSQQNRTGQQSKHHRRHKRQLRKNREIQRRRQRAARKQMQKFESSARKAGLLPPKPSKSARNKARLAKQLAGGVTEWTLYTPVPLPVSTTRRGLKRREGDSHWDHDETDMAMADSDKGGPTASSSMALERPILKRAATAQAVMYDADTPPGSGSGMPQRHHHHHHHHHHRHGHEPVSENEPKEQVLHTISFLAVKDRLYALRHHIRQRDHVGGDLGMLSSSAILEDPRRMRGRADAVATGAGLRHAAGTATHAGSPNLTGTSKTTKIEMPSKKAELVRAASSAEVQKPEMTNKPAAQPVSLPRDSSFPSSSSAEPNHLLTGIDPIESSVLDVGGPTVLLDPSPLPPRPGGRRRAASTVQSFILELEDGDLALPPPALELEGDSGVTIPGAAATRAGMTLETSVAESGAASSSSPVTTRSRRLSMFSTGSRARSKALKRPRRGTVGTADASGASQLGRSPPEDSENAIAALESDDSASDRFDFAADERRTGWHMSDVPLTPLVWRRETTKFWSAFERQHRQRERSGSSAVAMAAGTGGLSQDRRRRIETEGGGVPLRERAGTVTGTGMGMGIGTETQMQLHSRSQSGAGGAPPLPPLPRALPPLSPFSALEELRSRRVAPMGLEERLRAGVEMGREGSQDAARQAGLRPSLALGTDLSTSMSASTSTVRRKAPTPLALAKSPLGASFERAEKGGTGAAPAPGSGSGSVSPPQEGVPVEPQGMFESELAGAFASRAAEDLTASQFITPPSSGDGTGSSKPSVGAWWLDVKCPTYSDMKDLSKLFPLHPLTVEDILQQDPREKVEVFEKLGYYFITIRAIDETYFRMNADDAEDGKPRINLLSGVPGKDGIEGVSVGAVNLYLVVFSHGLITFHFEEMSKHTTRVLKRLMDLSQTMDFTADWIAHGLMDSLVDAFFPLLALVESEVAEFEEIVELDPKVEHNPMDPRYRHSKPMDERARAWRKLFSGERRELIKLRPFKARHASAEEKEKKAKVNHQTELLRRMATVRKIVTGLTRLLAPKSESVVSLRKRYMELSAMSIGAPRASRTEVSIHMGDLHDHIVTLLTQLHQSDDRLNDTHADYLSVVSIKNRQSRQRADRSLVGLVTVTLTAVLCTFWTSLWSFNVLIPMNEHGSHDYLLFALVVGTMGIITVSLQVYVRHLWVQAKKRQDKRTAKR